MIIRKADKTDFRVLLAFDEAHWEEGSPYYQDYIWWDYLTSSGVTGAYILVNQQEVCGFLTIWEDKEGELEIRQLFIAAAFQNKGLGGQLLETALAVIDTIQSDCSLHVHENNEPAVHLYTKFGFVATGERTEDGEDSMIVMQRAPFAHIQGFML